MIGWHGFALPALDSPGKIGGMMVAPCVVCGRAIAEDENLPGDPPLCSWWCADRYQHAHEGADVKEVPDGD